MKLRTARSTRTDTLCPYTTLFRSLKVLDRFDGGAAGRGDAHHGEVHVVRRVAGYKKIRYYTHENIGYGPVNLPDQELHTTAAWWQLPQTVLLRAFASKQDALDGFLGRSEEHTSELQSLMRTSYAVFCLKKQTN